MKWQTYEKYLRQILCQKLGLPIVGKIFFTCVAGSSTSLFEEYFRTDLDIPADLLFTGNDAVINAQAEMSANRNDVVVVGPGRYTQSANLAWNKNRTHLIGLAKLQQADYGAQGAELLNTETDVVQAILTSGYHCQFHGIKAYNAGANAACKAAWTETGRHNYFKDCVMVGLVQTQQSQNASCANLWISTATGGAGLGDKFEDCYIGDAGTATRTVANGSILFGLTGAAAAGSSMTFKGCQILSRATDTDPCGVLVSANYCADRMVLFDDCMFYNMRFNMSSTQPAYVVRDACGTTHSIIFKNSAHHGFTAWTNKQKYTFVTMPIPDESGGEALAGDAA